MPSLCLPWIAALAQALAPPAAAPIGGGVGDLALRDQRGTLRRLDGWDKGRILVVAFVGVECPLSELYAGALAGLADEYGPRGVSFLGLAPNRRDAPDALDRFARSHRIPFPVVADRGGAAAARLGAARVPSVVVLDTGRAVRYRGRIDDQYTLTARRAGPQARDLAAALDALLAGRPVERPETEAIGCPIDQDRAGDEAESDSEASTDAPTAPTYGADVAPILRRRCVSCHRKGQVAPFGLTTYRQATGWADAIAAAVEDRRMPPWSADPAYGTFANDAHLSEREIRTLVAWARGDRAEGEPIGPLVAASPAGAREDGWSIPGPDLVVSMPRPFRVPAQGVVDYQEFEVDPGFSEERWVVAAEIRPGNRAVVHHCTVFLKPPGAGEPRFTPGELGSFCLAATAPGTPPLRLPPGMAKRVPAGWRLLFVVHYTPVGTEQLDRTSLGLTFVPASAVRREVVTRLLYDPDLRIPPRAPDTRVEQDWRVPYDVLLLGMFPHMHLRGKSFRYEADYPDGTTEVLLNVPRYDFEWQHRYDLATPKPIPAGTTLRCIAHYDNSAANPANPDPNATVRTGKQSSDEMFNGYFDLALPGRDPSPPGGVVAAYLRHVQLAAGLVSLSSCGLAWRLARLRRTRRGRGAAPAP
jgi:peroxiredoxin